MEKILKKLSIKMIVILGLLLGVFLWVNGLSQTVSAQMPPIPTPTPALPPTMPISESIPVDPFPFEPAPPIPFPGDWCSGQPTEEGASIAGSVVDPDGNPVANSYIEVHEQTSEMWCHEVFTDESGAFQVYGLTAGTWILSAQSFGIDTGLQAYFPSPTIEITVAEDAETIELADPLQLSGPQATGQVLMPDGTPASDGGVNLYMLAEGQTECTGSSNEEDMYHNYAYGFTYIEGLFKVGGLTAGTYCVQVIAPWNQGTLGTPAPSQFTLSTESSEVVDLGTFQLIAPTKTIEVVVSYANSEGTTAGLADVNVNIYSEEKGGWLDGLTDSDGKYTAQVGGGSWHVSVYPGYESGVSMFQDEVEPQIVTFADDETEENQTVPFEVQVPTSSVTARIVTPDGEPVPANTQAMEEMGYYGGIHININSVGDGWYYASAIADENGQFKLFLPAGEYEMTIHVDPSLYPKYYSPASQTFTLTEDQALDLGDIELGQIDSFIIGRLVGADGGALPTPSPINEAYGYKWDDENYIGISVHAYNDQHGVHQEIDASGSFSLPLPAGEYTLEFYLESWLYADSFAPAPQTIESVEGETTDLGDIPLQAAQVSGSIQNGDGEPVGYANFQIYSASADCMNEYSERSFYGTADEAGQFSVGGLPAGDYCLMVDAYWGMGGLFAPDPVRFTITEGGEPVDLGVIAYRGPSKSIEGAVLSTNGEGIPNVMVNAHLQDGRHGWAEAVTDADGRFTLDVIGGVWHVHIYPGYREEYPASMEQPWFSENTHQVVNFAQDETEEAQQVEFQVQLADATLTGRVVAPDGTAISVENMGEMADDMPDYHDYGYAAISVNVYSRSGYGNSTTVAEDGTFSLPVIGGNYEVSIYVDEYMYPNYYSPETLSIRVEDGDTADLGDISLGEKNATIQGQVLAPDGTGVANVSLSAYSGDGWMSHGWANTRTDEQGAYTMTVRAGDWEVSIQSYMNSTESTGYFLLNTTQQTSVAENETATVNFTAQGAAGNILGEIVDTDGLPITDLDVMAYARRVSDVEDADPEVVAAERDTSAPFPTPPPMPYPEPYGDGDYGYGYHYGYDVIAQSMSEQGQFTLAVPSGVYEVGLYLPHNSDYVFAGEVGTSVTDSAERIIQASSRGQVAQANAVGERRVTVAPAGTAEDVTVQLVLLRNDAKITGTLLDSNGEPVTGVVGEVYGWMDGPSGSHQSAKIDPETGTYELTVAGGTWYLDFSIESDAYVNYGGGEALSVAVEPKGSAQKDITLRSLDAVIQGTVTDPEGNPIRWGHVWADMIPPEKDEPEEDEPAAFFYHGTSAEVIDGEFEMQAISGLTYVVNASGGGDYVLPASQVVTPTTDSPTVVNLQFRTTDGVISGTLSAIVDEATQPGAAGYVYGWSDDGQHANVEADAEGNFSFEVASGSVWYLGASWWPTGSEVFYHTEDEVMVDLTASTNGTAKLTLVAQDYPMPPMIVEPFMADEDAAYTLDDGTKIEIPAGAISLGNATDAPDAPIEEAPVAPEPAPAQPSVPSAPGRPITDEDIADRPESDDGEEAADDGVNNDGGGGIQAQEARINVAPMVEDMPCTLTACPVGYGYNVAVYDNATGEQMVRNFNANVKMTFHYTDEELAEANADEDSIAPAYFSSASNTWNRLDSFTIDKEANQIVAEIGQPGRWALVTAADVEIRVPTALPTNEEPAHQVFLPITMK